MSRYKASFIHLLISAALVGSVFAVVFFVWYPKPAFAVTGASSIVFMLIGIDLILGPLLTLIVYRQGKPGLKFDLSVIALVQLTALVYGTHTLFEERPSYVVFAIDRVEFIARKDVDESQIRFESLRSNPLGSLVHAVARSPEDPEEFQRFFDSVMFDGKPDLERRPEYWEPWHDGADIIRSRIQPLASVEGESDGEKAALERARSRYGSAYASLGLLPVGGTEEDLAALIDTRSLTIIDVVHVDVW